MSRPRLCRACLKPFLPGERRHVEPALMYTARLGFHVELLHLHDTISCRSKFDPWADQREPTDKETVSTAFGARYFSRPLNYRSKLSRQAAMLGSITGKQI